MERSGPVTLLQAVGSYVSSVKGNEDQGVAQRVLHRFVDWCGRDRTLAEINPPEIGEYADHLGATGTTPEAADRLQIIRDFLSYARKKRLTDKNLAQHVRVRKSKSLSKRRGGPGGPEAIKLTRDGLNRLQAELDKLKGDRGPLAMQIRKAAADKDVKENVPLEAAREQLGHAEARIRTIESTLKYSVVIDSTGKAAVRVGLGSQVSVRDIGSGRKTTYILVSAAEANPLEGKISDVSPLGKALLKRYAGEEVEFDTPRGKTRYRVMKITS